MITPSEEDAIKQRIVVALKQLQEDGKIVEHVDLDAGTRGRFSLTPEGLRAAKAMIHERPDVFAFFFQTFWNVEVCHVIEHEPNQMKSAVHLLKAAQKWNEEFPDLPFLTILERVLENAPEVPHDDK